MRSYLRLLAAAVLPLTVANAAIIREVSTADGKYTNSNHTASTLPLTRPSLLNLHHHLALPSHPPITLPTQTLVIEEWVVDYLR